MWIESFWPYENSWVDEQWKEWIWGIEVTDINSLYARYSFLKKAEYDNLRGLLEEAKSDIELIWEWANWFVINHPTDWFKVIKVWKPEKDDIAIEFQTHNEIFNSLVALREMEWLGVDESIKAPRVIFHKGDNFIEMEKIKWQTFKTKFYIDYYAEQLQKLWMNDDVLSELSDADLDKVLIDNNLQRLALPDIWYMTPEETLLEEQYTDWWEQVYDSPKLEKARVVVDLIGIGSQEDIFILDRNAWNIMEASDGTIYLIDFGHID